MAEKETPEEKAEAATAFWDVDEQEALAQEAELAATPEPEIPADQEKPVVEEPAVEEPPAEEEQPAKEEPPAEELPEAAKPVEEKPVEDKKAKDDSFAWRELRRLRREKREREAADAAAAAAKPPPVATPAEPAEEEIIDPIERAERAAKAAAEVAKQANEAVEKIRLETEQQRQQREINDEIVRQESAFKITHADYDEALNHVVEARREQYEITGRLDAEAEQWIEKRPDLVERHAQETGLNPDEYGDIKKAAKDIAFRIAIHQEREQLVANCKRTGKNVAEAVYTLAAKMGHKPKAAAVEEKPVPEKPAPEAAKERVQKAKEAAEKQAPFRQKLAAMDTNPTPGPKKITTREELMRLPDSEQDQFLEKMDDDDPMFLEKLEKWEG